MKHSLPFDLALLSSSVPIALSGTCPFLPVINHSNFEIFTLLGCYIVYTGSNPPMLWDNLLVPSSNPLPLKMRLTGCPEKSVTYYQSMLHNIPEEQRSHLCHGISLKSHSSLLWAIYFPSSSVYPATFITWLTPTLMMDAVCSSKKCTHILRLCGVLTSHIQYYWRINNTF